MLICSGIDYSLTSPGICVHRGKIWKPNKCKLYGLDSRKTFVPIKTDNIFIDHYPAWETQQERHRELARWTADKISSTARACVEDYAMGAKGRMTAIAENTGVLKHILYEKGIVPEVVAPTTLKKFATGSGRAKKEDMIEAFRNECSIDASICKAEDDLVDAYFICKWIFEKNINTK